MRGEAKRRLRATNLRLLNDQYTYKHIAEVSGTDEVYLSQIANEYVGKGRKSPRALSDSYVEKIEMGLHLPAGWMDEDHDSPDMMDDIVAEETVPYMAQEKASVAPGPDTRGFVPLISWVQAGAWHEAEDHYLPGEAEQFLPCPARHGMHAYALRVEGDSMTAQFGRSYPDGCIIYIDPDQAGGVVSGDRVIAKINGDAKVTFKVFIEEAGQRFLRPLNPQYPIITDEFRIIGKVIGSFIPE